MSPDRRQSRELCLQVLFQREFLAEMDEMEALKTFRSNFEFSDEVWSYTESLLEKIQNNASEIDQLLQSCISHWSLERLAIVDKNLMRIAIVELKYHTDLIPPKVAINESLELAKKYSSTDSASFINGVLDQALKTLQQKN